MTRRWYAPVAAAAAAVAIGAGGTSALQGGGSDGAYRVRAIFDNASFLVAGEDVKVAGVKVGTIDSLDLTAQNKAAVVLRINDPQFKPFRTDAHCEIGLQSLIGEQFVQCTPTQPRAPNAPAPPPLPAIATGPGTGQHLLAVDHTTTPVGVDLLNNITRLPERQRLTLIISELGAGLAGNGEELRMALYRADPALQQTDQVIRTLASQDQLLARLTDESDRVLAPLAAQRAHVGGFIQHTGEVAVAAAQRGAAIEANFRKFPPFLQQLRPAANRLANLASQITPALQSLQAQAPAVNASVKGLGATADASIPALRTLGNVAQRGTQTFPRIHSLATQLDALGTPLNPLATDIAALASSFDSSGGIEDVMRFIYYYTGTVNGEDAVGHYIRSSFEVGACSSRSSSHGPGCGSTFATTTQTTAAQARTPALQARLALNYLLGP